MAMRQAFHVGVIFEQNQVDQIFRLLIYEFRVGLYQYRTVKDYQLILRMYLNAEYAANLIFLNIRRLQPALWPSQACSQGRKVVAGNPRSPAHQQIDRPSKEKPTKKMASRVSGPEDDFTLHQIALYCMVLCGIA